MEKRNYYFSYSFLISYLLSLIFFKTVSGIAFLIFFCFGVAISGMILRSSLNLFLKLYYSIFLFSLIIFLYSPSLLFSLLAQQKLSDKKGTEFLLTGNYYLVKQQSMLDLSNKNVKYKIAKRSREGLIKPCSVNISFHHEIDSVKVLKFDAAKDAALRGYFVNGNNSVDSIDILTDLKMHDENEITVQH